jgi:hypothetical protein
MSIGRLKGAKFSVLPQRIECNDQLCMKEQRSGGQGGGAVLPAMVE